MRGAEIDLLRLARGRTVAGTVVGSAQVGAALDDSAWRLATRQRDVLQLGAARIDRLLARVIGPIPIARPLPDIADHVVEETRVVLQDQLLEIWSRTGVTIMFITHDLHEAIGLGDQVVLVSARPGRIIRVD